jgi:hypothetical protein
MMQGVREAISDLFRKRSIEVLPQPVPDFTNDLPELDKPEGLRLLTPGFQAAIADVTARVAAEAPLKCVKAISGAQVLLTCQDFATYVPTIVNMINTSSVVDVQDVFTATMGNKSGTALAAAQRTFDGHVTIARGSLPCEERALCKALTEARDDAARALDSLPVDGGFRPDSLARFDAYVAGVTEHVLLDNTTESRTQCRGVWADHVRQLEIQQSTFTSTDELNAAVAARRLAMKSAMVGPYRDTEEMADEVSSWVNAAITSLGHRTGMEQAKLDAE